MAKGMLISSEAEFKSTDSSKTLSMFADCDCELFINGKDGDVAFSARSAQKVVECSLFRWAFHCSIFIKNHRLSGTSKH